MSTQAVTMLCLVSIVCTAFIAWIVVILTGAPVAVGAIIAVALFCIDVASVAMVWYANARRAH